MRHLADEELAARICAQRSDSLAEAELHRRFAGRVRLYALRHLPRHLADDLAQQVMLVAIESLRAGRVREHRRLASFVLGTARICAHDLRRASSRAEPVGLDAGANLAAEPPRIDPEPSEALRRCLEHLPPKEHAVVLLTFFGERDGEQIAAELGTTSGNVRVVRHRAMAHLRDCMGVEA